MTGIHRITYYGLRGMRYKSVYCCDLLYLCSCTAVAYICLPALVAQRVACSPVGCCPNVCTLFTISETSTDAAGHA